ncbi:MAG: hypothetical protein DDT23_00041 [candidate division WS2 bacterium]|nr:hypothetical protein [Candidatus Lithacetigena glycinireducens]
MERRIYSVTQAARHSGYSRVSIYLKIKAGIIQAVLLGDKQYISQRELNKLIKMKQKGKGGKKDVCKN